MKKHNNSFVHLSKLCLVFTILLSSCMDNEVENLDLGEIDHIAGRSMQCSSVTNMLWTDTPYSNSIEMHISDNKTFRTNTICNASSYTWTVGGEASMITTVPYVNLSGIEFLWFPAAGCSSFNATWNAYNPLGGSSLGDYTTTISVKSNVTSTITIPVIVADVEKCTEFEPVELEDEEDEEEGENPFPYTPDPDPDLPSLPCLLDPHCWG